MRTLLIALFCLSLPLMGAKVSFNYTKEQEWFLGLLDEADRPENNPKTFVGVKSKGEVLAFEERRTFSRVKVKIANGDIVYIRITQNGVLIKDGVIASQGKMIFEQDIVDSVAVAAGVHKEYKGYQTPAKMRGFLISTFTQAALEAPSRQEYIKRLNKVRVRQWERYLDDGVFRKFSLDAPGLRAASLKKMKAIGEKGNAIAQKELAGRYMFGLGVKRDPVEAVKWLRKIAKQGDAASQMQLGMMHYTGLGIGKISYREAVKWFRKSAEQGNDKGQVWLGLMYANAEGVNKDVREAMKWWHKSAVQGNGEAQFNLGWKYYIGIEIPTDKVAAYAWWSIASANSNEDAKKFKATRLDPIMAPIQVTKAEALVKEMVKKNPKLIK